MSDNGGEDEIKPWRFNFQSSIKQPGTTEQSTKEGQIRRAHESFVEGRGIWIQRMGDSGRDDFIASQE